MNIQHILVATGVLLAAVGCRDDAGTPDYSDVQGAFDRVDAGPEPPLEGPDPYIEGETRLSLGVFYESGFSEEIPADGTRSNYFIFQEGAQLTYSQQPDELRIEGQQSDRITLVGTSFWGGGVVIDPPVDLSEYDVLAVSLLSSDIAEVNITVGDAGLEVGMSAANYGYVNDGLFHNLRIPLSDYAEAGVDLSAVRLPFAIGAPGGDADAEIVVDDMYIEAE
ncbi:MAG: hypothetical protein AAGC55_22940 [Myxococcota bacterium]